MVIEVLRALGRRWYVVAVGLLLTAALVFGAYKATPPEYNARALVLLLPPKADVGKGGNPFLLLSGLEQPAGILAAYFSSAPARAEVEALSPKAEYEVGIDDSTRGPVIAIDVTDQSPTSALTTLDFLLKRIPEELADLQQQVDTRGDAIVGSMTLSVDEKAEADIRGTVRLMIAALVAGLVATGFAAVAIDGFIQRRSEATPFAEADEGEGEGDLEDRPADLSEPGVIEQDEVAWSDAVASPADNVEAKPQRRRTPLPASAGESDGHSAAQDSAVDDGPEHGPQSDLDRRSIRVAETHDSTAEEDAEDHKSAWSW